MRLVIGEQYHYVDEVPDLHLYSQNTYHGDPLVELGFQCGCGSIPIPVEREVLCVVCERTYPLGTDDSLTFGEYGLVTDRDVAVRTVQAWLDALALPVLDSVLLSHSILEALEEKE